MRGEQKFQHVFAGSFDLFALGDHDHALRNGGGAGRFQLGAKTDLGAAVSVQHGLAGGTVHHGAAHIHEAHAAHAHRFHLGVIAEDGDIHASLFGGIDN